MVGPPSFGIKPERGGFDFVVLRIAEISQKKIEMAV